ncbi:hypothetical protein [Mycobacterium sp. NPDC050853]|uniref:hypothetical protein n=1 Tax=Mycobacterium sp. NPDC050853 TaxID=3155160 RepID=UPI0033E474DD
MVTYTATARIAVDARSALRDRVLVAVSSQDAIAVAAGIAATGASGLVIVDKVATRSVRVLKQIYGSALTIATDPASYMRYKATVEAPMQLPAILDWPAMSLDEYMHAQLAAGQDIAFMPAGRVTDLSVLAAVIAAANTVDASNVVVPVAVSAAMLKPEIIGHLISALSRSRHPVAFVVTGQFDPFADEVTAAGLRTLTAATESFVHRTDFAAFEAVAHGGLGGAIGWSTRLRHAVPGYKPADTRKKPPDRSPVVLVPDIDSYRHTAVIEPWFRNSLPPVCTIAGCCGRNLTLLRDNKADHAAACEHNVRSWMPIAKTLLAQPPSRRREWLYNYRIDIEIAYGQLRRRTGVLTIEMDEGQSTWLSLGL